MLLNKLVLIIWLIICALLFGAAEKPFKLVLVEIDGAIILARLLVKEVILAKIADRHGSAFEHLHLFDDDRDGRDGGLSH